MKGYVIYSAPEARRNSWYIDRYIEEFARRGADLSLLIREQILSPGSLRADFIIMRHPEPELSELFERSGIKVFNSAEVSRIANDKENSAWFARRLGIPAPPALCTADRLADPVFPAVMKPPRGRGGKGVTLVRDLEEYSRAFEGFGGERYIYQRAVSDLGRDMRVYVLGGKILTAFLRVSDSDFRSNYCLGGKAYRCEPGSRIRAMTEKMLAACDFGFAGIDFIFDRGGHPLFNEIEDVVGARMIYDKTDLDPAVLYTEYILGRLRGEGHGAESRGPDHT